MSYKPLTGDDADDSKSYGSVDSTEITISPLLGEELIELGGHEPFEKKNPFADDEAAAYWRQVYDDCQYECRHEFDPLLTWSAEEERHLVRKLDWKVCLWAVSSSILILQLFWSLTWMQCVMFFGLQVDRANLSQAISDNMLDDLGLSTNGTVSH
jgi:hypothetical protein